MIKIFRLALLATCVPLFAATPDERCEAASKLLDGVSAIDVGGGAIPGPLVLLSDNAIPLADCELDGTRAFAAAAAFYGGGRAVYLGHPAYLEADKHLADTSSLLRNAIRWLGAGKTARIIRETAMEEGIPVMEDRPLARALYAEGRIDDFIPDSLIEPVAEVLKWAKRIQDARKEEAELDAVSLEDI